MFCCRAPGEDRGTATALLHLGIRASGGRLSIAEGCFGEVWGAGLTDQQPGAFALCFLQVAESPLAGHPQDLRSLSRIPARSRGTKFIAMGLQSYSRP